MSARQERLDACLSAECAPGKLPGALAIVWQRGETACRAVAGMRDAAARSPMNDDAIFRIYSMTKPLTSVAAMILCEEGRLGLDDPVAAHMPEFRGLRVGTETRDPVTGRTTVPTIARSTEMTIVDLLRHTSGLAGGVAGTPAISRLYAEARIRPFDHTADGYESTTQQLVEQLATLPLAHAPGTVWEYGRSGDVLGRLLEIVSGRSLDAFLAERVFIPLHMQDTGFWVEPAKLARLAQPAPSEERRLISPARPPAFISGGSGAFSTAADYLRFLRMLANGGELDGTRILAPQSVALMTADHLGALRGTGPDYIPGSGYGFGLGFGVRGRTGPWDVPGSAGDYYWLGRAGTNFFVDPSEEMIGIFMSQVYGRARHYQALFKKVVYGESDI